jgi:iron complex outermembrane receptor protein
MPAPFFPLRPTAIASLLALNALTAMAQTPAAEPAPSGALAPITVEASADASAEGLTKPFAGGQVARGGRVGILGNQDMMSTPFSSTSYTNELIQNQQARSVADVLQNDPTVRVARGFGNFQESYFIRGFIVNSDDIAYNGLYGLLPRQYISSELFERVEVFRGASAFLNGATPTGGGIGGNINLLPKRAPNDPLTKLRPGRRRAARRAMSRTDIARRFGPDQSLGVRLNAAHRDGGTGVDGEAVKLDVLSVGLDWRSRDARMSADFGYQDYDLKDGRPSLTPSSNLPIPRAPDAKSNFAQPWTYSKEKDKFATFRGEVDITDNITAWAAGGVRRSDEDNVLSNPTLVNSFGNTSNTRFSNTRKDRIGTAEIGVRGNFATGPVKHTVVASAATYSNDRDNAYAISRGAVLNNIYAPFFSPNPVANGFTGNTLEDPRLTDKIDTSSIAIADTMSFMEDRLLVTLGARRQTIKQTSFAYNTIKESSAYDKSKTTPVAGVVFKITPTVSAYANYIEALVKGNVAPGTVNNRPVTNAGDVFAPYQAKQKEIGVKYDGGTLGASAAFFTTDQPVYQYSGQTYGLYGKQRNQGLEFSVFGQPAKGLRLLGGLTLLDAKQKNTQGGATDGLTAIGVAKQQANLGAEWDVPSVRNLSLNARLLYTSKQYANATNTQQIPGWTRFDIGARYLVDLGNGRALTLRARIDNLFNKSYWASVGGTQGSNYLVIGAPRTVAVSGTIDF